MTVPKINTAIAMSCMLPINTATGDLLGRRPPPLRFIIS
jgi:hypothetical protein